MLLPKLLATALLRRLIITASYGWHEVNAMDFNCLFWKDKAFVKAIRE